MDVLADLLDGARARGAVFNQTIRDPPWALRIADQAPLAVATMLRGESWIVPDVGEPVRLRTRDVAIMRGPAPYTVADDPATAPQGIVGPGGRYTTVDGVEIVQEPGLGVRTCASESLDGSAMVISGTYDVHGAVSDRLLAALPPVLVVAADGPVVDLVVAEVTKDEPGQQVVLDRLLDLLFVTTLRNWFARPGSHPPAWYGAHSDPVVGTALRLLHADPAYPWTVAVLAAKVGVSRAAFARRFTALLGQPPMAYLAEWRLTLAADLLREPTATVAAVARKVGYANAFALSVAFKRVHGVTPTQHRAGAAIAFA